MIDLLETVITYLSADADLRLLVGDRIAPKHQFAIPDLPGQTGAWPTPSKALTLSYDPGATPDVYAGWERGRLDVKCYGESPQEAGKVYRRLIDMQDAFLRTTVQTGQGKALLYYLVQDTSAQADRDPDVRIDLVRVMFKAATHHEAVP